VTRRLVTATAAATMTVAIGAELRRRAPGGRDRWTRQNFRDRAVDLFAGPAAAAGAVTAAALAAPPRGGGRLAGAVAAAAGLGLYDDLAGVTHARGLRGHFRALAHGEVTTGIVKLAGLAAAGLVAAPCRTGRCSVAQRLADGALISGAANLVNLLDLRPGRALKTVAFVGLPLAVSGTGPGAAAAAGALASTAALLPGDLDERHMIGDCGANALGALVGWALAERLGICGRLAALSAVIGLTLASERISFSAVIDNQLLLRSVDRWGRQP